MFSRRFWLLVLWVERHRGRDVYCKPPAQADELPRVWWGLCRFPSRFTRRHCLRNIAASFVLIVCIYTTCWLSFASWTWNWNGLYAFTQLKIDTRLNPFFSSFTALRYLRYAEVPEEFHISDSQTRAGSWSRPAGSRTSASVSGPSEIRARYSSRIQRHPSYRQTRVPVGADEKPDATFATLHPGRGVLKPDELFTRTSHQIREPFLSNTFLSLHHAPTSF